ncbi:MAG: hypothetical protein R2778_00880 [Saprospiraceae bacterium]
MNLEIYIERIEQYESGQMTAAERSAFEAELSTNAELKQAHTFFLGANEVIEQGIENSLRNQLNDWAAAEAGTSAKPAKTKVVSMQTTWVRMAIAASVTLLIGWFGLQWMSNQYTDQALYSGFYEKPGDSTFRGGPSEHPLKLGYEAFQKNDFAAAVSFFNSIPDSSDYYAEAQYYLGHSFIPLKEYNQAIKAFQHCASRSESKFSEKAEWYLLLTYLNSGKTNDADFKALLDKLLSNPDHSFYEQAKKLSGKINSVWRRFAE